MDSGKAKPAAKTNPSKPALENPKQSKSPVLASAPESKPQYRKVLRARPGRRFVFRLPSLSRIGLVYALEALRLPVAGR